MVEVLSIVVCITVLEGIAISKGMNGTTLALVIAVLAGLGGYEIKVFRNKLEQIDSYELPKDLME